MAARKITRDSRILQCAQSGACTPQTFWQESSSSRHHQSTASESQRLGSRTVCTSSDSLHGDLRCAPSYLCRQHYQLWSRGKDEMDLRTSCYHNCDRRTSQLVSLRSGFSMRCDGHVLGHRAMPSSHIHHGLRTAIPNRSRGRRIHLPSTRNVAALSLRGYTVIARRTSMRFAMPQAVHAALGQRVGFQHYTTGWHTEQ